jgi:hypothetical protein
MRSTLRPRLVSTELVKSGITSPNLPLTACDILTSHSGIPIFYVYPQGLDLERLRKSLRETATVHRMATGRMQRLADGRDWLVGNDAGMALKVWDCDGPLPDYGPHHPMHRDASRLATRFIPWQVIHQQKPLLNFEVYRFADGGVILSVVGVHTLVDAATMWNFLGDWSRLARGLDVVGPVVERNVLFDLMQTLVDCPDTRQVMESPALLPRASLYARLGVQALQNQLGVYRVRAATIEGWRQALPEGLTGGDRLSAADLVSAHVLKLMSEAQGHDRDLTVGLVSDLRYRKGLELPQRLVGNALGQEAVDYTVAEMAKQGEAQLALKLKQPGAMHTLDEVKGYLGMLERRRRNKTLGELMPRSVSRSAHGGYLQNNYNHLPIYQVDLGTGAPSWFNPMAVPFRMLKIIPTPAGDGGVDIHLTATPKELVPLAQRYGECVI